MLQAPRSFYPSGTGPYFAALFGLTEQAWWQNFARWYAGLPLT